MSRLMREDADQHLPQRESLHRDALTAWNHYQTTGPHLAEEEVDAWLARLEASEDADAPACHV